jgi:hypothetical protein
MSLNKYGAYLFQAQCRLIDTWALSSSLILVLLCAAAGYTVSGHIGSTITC